MGYIVWMVILALIVIGLIFSNKKVSDPSVVKINKIVSGCLVTLIVVITLISLVHQIPAGHVGVVYKFGSIIGQIPEGLQFVAPWKNVLVANTQVQSFHFKKLDSFSFETQDVFVEATLNLNVSPDAIQKLYRTVGPNWFEVLVAPRVAQNFKDETVKHKSVDIAPNREVIRQVVRERLEKELSPYSIEVRDLLLENVDFKPEFKAAIESKQIATQKALEEEQRVLVEKHKAEQAVETAKGAAEAILINATKQAEANKKLSASLTPELIQWTLVSRLADKIEVMILPSGQNFILGQDMLRKVKPEK